MQPQANRKSLSFFSQSELHFKCTRKINQKSQNKSKENSNSYSKALKGISIITQ